MSIFAKLRTDYHCNICSNLLGYRSAGVPNVADSASQVSIDLALRMVKKMAQPLCKKPPESGQTTGADFAKYTKLFLDEAFASRLGHLRPGPWKLTTSQQEIGQYEQYRHMAELAKVIADKPELKTALGGDYLITPDIVVARVPVDDTAINQSGKLVDGSEPIAKQAPLRQGNIPGSPAILHASISCKWSMRSDRAQNTRTEALNLIRNRKGNTPHIMVVTMEPMPTRLASIAMGTGDVDCTYHAALHELMAAAKESGREDQAELLNDLVAGRRLRDISDLPLDLAI